MSPGRARFGLAIALAMGLGVPTAARAAVACPDLVKAIDAGIEGSRSRLAASPDPPADDDLAGVWDPVPFLFPGYEIRRAQFACWQARKGRPVDAATRLAVIRASRFLRTKRNNEFKAHGRFEFSWLEDGLVLERATGVFGPISGELKARGLAPYGDRNDPQALKGGFDGGQWEGADSAHSVTQALAELAALCMVHPDGYQAFIRSLGYEPDLLQPKPSGRINDDEPDPAQLAFLDAERDRIVRDCPT